MVKKNIPLFSSAPTCPAPPHLRVSIEHPRWAEQNKKDLYFRPSLRSFFSSKCIQSLAPSSPPLPRRRCQIRQICNMLLLCCSDTSRPEYFMHTVSAVLETETALALSSAEGLREGSWCRRSLRASSAPSPGPRVRLFTSVCLFSLSVHPGREAASHHAAGGSPARHQPRHRPEDQPHHRAVRVQQGQQDPAVPGEPGGGPGGDQHPGCQGEQWGIVGIGAGNSSAGWSLQWLLRDFWDLKEPFPIAVIKRIPGPACGTGAGTEGIWVCACWRSSLSPHPLRLPWT